MKPPNTSKSTSDYSLVGGGGGGGGWIGGEDQVYRKKWVFL